MELKSLITHFTYRIEPKPEGGFVAHATDPSAPALEAPTREELQKKIQANIFAALEMEFPGLKIPTEGKEAHFAFHIEHKPEGGFAIRSADPSVPPIEGTTHEDIAHPFAEKLFTFVGHYLMPELEKALAAEGGSADVRVTTKTNTRFALNHKTKAFSSQGGETLSPSGSLESVIVDTPGLATVDASTIATDQNAQKELSSNSPITPEASGIWNILRLLIALGIVAVMVYIFMHRR
jgi:hypothetical protein